MNTTPSSLPEHSKNHPDFLPCPHCGGADIRVDCHRGAGRGIDHHGTDVWSMCCRSCGAAAPNRYSREVLLAAWNRRAAVEADRASRYTGPVTVNGIDLAVLKRNISDHNYTPTRATMVDLIEIAQRAARGEAPAKLRHGSDELRAAAAVVVQRWDLLRVAATGVVVRRDSPAWKEALHTDASIAFLRTALAAVEAAPVAQAQEVSAADLDIQRTALRDAIAESLSCTYVCCRVWEAWSYGTMSRDDFVPAGESDEVLDSVLAAIESVAAPVAQAQPAEPQDVPSDLIIEVAEAMQVRRILEQIKKLADTRPAGDPPSAFESGWALCCEEIFYRATGEKWHMDEDEAHFSATNRLKRLTSTPANEALAGVAQAQPESAPARVPMTPDEAGQLWRAVHAARSAGGDHHETSYVAFARAVEQRCGIGSAT